MLVIFDCDGVLVDSEPLANASFSRALKAHGLDWSVEETMRRLMGRSLKSCVEICEAEIGRKLPDDFVEKMQAVTYQSFRDAPLQPVAGVKDAIVELQKDGFDTCVASSGSPEKMRFTLGLTGLWDLFDGRIFSGHEMPRSKPAPDVYLAAMAQLGVRAERCLVVEDTVTGVTAGVAAGATVLGYSPPEAGHDAPATLRAAGASLVFTEMAQLPALLE